MNKKIIISVVLLLIFIESIFIYRNHRDNLFYLDNEYYLSNKFILVNNLKGLEHDNYIMYTYGDFCSFSTPCEDIFKSFMDEYNISFIKMHYDNFKNTKYYKTVKYPPSVLIIKRGKLVAYLDSEKDEDIDKYQDPLEFKNWVSKYVNLKNKNQE